jgi:hypothetical protein
MNQKQKLSPSMTLRQFDNGYWYTTELKDFGKSIGIPFANRLRKDELEQCIKVFLKTGKIESSTKRSFSTPGKKDIDLGLTFDLPIAVYTNNRETKDFLEKEARKIAPGLKMKSGARYRLNRWREQQLANGKRITYGDLVREYVRLNQTNKPFAKIPHGRYINFLSEFLKAEKDATRKQAINIWEELKALDIPKDYRSWKKYQLSKAK